MKIELEINKGRIVNLFCSAIEGGYCRGLIALTDTSAPTYGMEGLSEIKGWENGKYCYYYPLIGNGRLTFTDIGEDDTNKDDTDEGYDADNFNSKLPNYNIGYAEVISGLNIMAEKYPRHFANWISKDDDAITGCVFLQCCMFGEMKYA